MSQQQEHTVRTDDGGQLQTELRQLAQELEVADAVCFAGWVEDTDSFYHALDINTLTSLSEGFPYSLPEGARFALPTVATCVGGVPALIKHNVTGLLFQPRDHEALARCLALPARLYLLDEPFAGVDLPRALRILERLKALPAPVLLVSHEPAILAAANRVIDLDGPPLTLL